MHDSGSYNKKNKMEEDKKFLRIAIEKAQESVTAGGFPAGAVIVKDGQIIAEATSVGWLHNDPTAHAETAAVRKACEVLKTPNLEGCVLYGSLECCLMCFAVANWAGITRVVSASKKTQDMVKKGYYEGATDNAAINEQNNRKIIIDFVLDIAQESLAVVKNWEEKFSTFSKT